MSTITTAAMLKIVYGAACRERNDANQKELQALADAVIACLTVHLEEATAAGRAFVDTYPNNIVNLACETNRDMTLGKDIPSLDYTLERNVERLVEECLSKNTTRVQWSNIRKGCYAECDCALGESCMPCARLTLLGAVPGQVDEARLNKASQALTDAIIAKMTKLAREAVSRSERSWNDWVSKFLPSRYSIFYGFLDAAHQMKIKDAVQAALTREGFQWKQEGTHSNDRGVVIVISF